MKNIKIREKANTYIWNVNQYIKDEVLYSGYGCYTNVNFDRYRGWKK
jgi:hypothetical protein